MGPGSGSADPSGHDSDDFDVTPDCDECGEKEGGTESTPCLADKLNLCEYCYGLELKRRAHREYGDAPTWKERNDDIG